MDNRSHTGKLLRVSSEDRGQGQTNSNFNVSLNNSPFVQNCRGAVLKSVSFKNVFPNIFSGNRVFSFEYNGTPTSITVPIGQYNLTELVAQINLEIVGNAVVTGTFTLVETVVPAGASPAYNTRIQFIADLPVRIYGKNLGNAIADVLGIPPDFDTTSTTVLPPWLPDLGGLPVAYLCSTQLAGFNASASSNNGEVVAIITEIPINKPFGQQIYYEAKTSDLESIIYQNIRGLNNIDLQLCTRSNEILDLQQHSLTAVFRILPRFVHHTG